MTAESIADIDRDAARLHAEARKLYAEADKLMAERWKLDAEERKLRRDHDIAPWQLVIGGIAAGGGLVAATVALTKWLVT